MMDKEPTLQDKLRLMADADSRHPFYADQAKQLMAWAADALDAAEAALRAELEREGRGK